MKIFSQLPRRGGRSLFGLLGAVACMAACGACTDDANREVARDNSAMLPDSERVSSVPWNKPQGWENRSQLGQLANDPRIGGRQ